MATFDKIKEYLDTHNIPFTIIYLDGLAKSVDDVMEMSKGAVKKEEIIKTLICKNNDSSFVAYVLRGGDRLDTARLPEFKGLASSDEVFQIAHVEPGAVCPILLSVPVVMDARIQDLENVNMGSGDHIKGIEMTKEDFFKSVKNATFDTISVVVS